MARRGGRDRRSSLVRRQVPHSDASDNGTGHQGQRNEGDAEVFFPSDDRWYPVFTWFEGSASFAVRLDPADASNPVWAVGVSLATRLGAVIQGDEGELYDLRTGQLIRT